MTTRYDLFSQTPFNPSSLVDPPRWWAALRPDRAAFTFLANGEEHFLTYRDLDRKARAIGAVLQQMKLTGERALLLYEPGLQYISAFFGCLYGGVVAVPVNPPRPNRGAEGFASIARDAKARIVLTTRTLLPVKQSLLEQSALPADLLWLTTDDVAEGMEDYWRQPDLKADTLAFLQYTSGSTAKPKGVMVSHGNLLHNTAMIAHQFGCSAETTGVMWLPHFHDMGLIGAIVQPVHIGIPVTLMSPLAFLQRPFNWLSAISRNRDGEVISGGPNFAYDLCVSRITEEQKAALTLDHWRVAFCGAEMVRPDTLERFATAFKSCGFRAKAFFPCYGLAEATLFTAGGLKDAAPVTSKVQVHALEDHRVIEQVALDEEVRTLVSCGSSLPDQQVVIVNQETGLKCLPDEVGEVWVSGPSVAQGYWNLPLETEQTFHNYLADTGEGPFLRTGDLGFLQNGELFITGRLKDMIIVDGRNHYPTDIELTAAKSHPAIRLDGCAAFSIELDGREQLVLLAEVERKYRAADLRPVQRTVRQAVAALHDLRLHDLRLLTRMSVPRTSSGKIQRYACRAGYLSGKLE